MGDDVTSESAPDAAMKDGTSKGRTGKDARPSRGRGVASVVCIVVASLLLPLAGVTIWVRNLVLNTDRYTTTVKPLASDPAVQQAVAVRVSDAVVDSLDVEQRAKAALPEKAQFLAAPIATGAEQLVQRATLRVLETDQFERVWEVANRRAHDQVVDALTGRDTSRIKQDKGKVVLQLGPIAVKVAQQLERFGFGLPSNVDVSRVNVRYVLVDSSDLASIQDYTNLLDKLAWVLPILVLLLYAVAIVLAPRRRRAVVRVGVGVTIAMIVTVIAYNLGRTAYLHALPPGEVRHAAGAAAFDTLTRYLQRGFRALLVAGALTWLIAWLAGPSRAAVAVRHQWGRLVGKAGEAGSPGPVNLWVAVHVGLLRAAVVVIAGLLLVTWSNPTGLTVLVLVVLTLVVLGAIQLVAAGAGPGDEANEAEASQDEEPATTGSGPG
jgi:hypothetical protein